MKSWTRWNPVVALTLPVLAAAAVLALVATGPVAPVHAATELDGRTLFTDSGCELCHGVSTAGLQAKTKFEKMRGPDLVNLEGKRTSDWMLAYMRGDETLRGEKHKKAFTGSDEELGALVAWLFDQKK